MTLIEIPKSVFDIIEKNQSTGTKINPTQIVRAALLHYKQSNLNVEQVFSLIGFSETNNKLTDSLRKKIK